MSTVPALADIIGGITGNKTLDETAEWIRVRTNLHISEQA